jgi:hypothetical protein
VAESQGAGEHAADGAAADEHAEGGADETSPAGTGSVAGAGVDDDEDRDTTNETGTPASPLQASEQPTAAKDGASSTGNAALCIFNIPEAARNATADQFADALLALSQSSHVIEMAAAAVDPHLSLFIAPDKGKRRKQRRTLREGGKLSALDVEASLIRKEQRRLATANAAAGLPPPPPPAPARFDPDQTSLREEVLLSYSGEPAIQRALLQPLRSHAFLRMAASPATLLLLEDTHKRGVEELLRRYPASATRESRDHSPLRRAAADLGQYENSSSEASPGPQAPSSAKQNLR